MARTANPDQKINFATDYKYPFETLGGAVAALDYNNDGWMDLFFLNGAPSPGHVRTDPAFFNCLYRNNGDGTFADVTETSGLSGRGIKGYPQGVAVGDYDNDGRMDIFVTNDKMPNFLYHSFGDRLLNLEAAPHPSHTSRRKHGRISVGRDTRSSESRG